MQLSALGPGTCISIPADVSKLSGVGRLVQEIETREHALHVLVNNAGTVWAQSLDEYPVGSIAVYLNLKLTCIAGRRLLQGPYFKSAKNLYFNTETPTASPRWCCPGWPNRGCLR